MTSSLEFLHFFFSVLPPICSIWVRAPAQALTPTWFICKGPCLHIKGFLNFSGWKGCPHHLLHPPVSHSTGRGWFFVVEQSTALPSDELRGAEACQVALGWGFPPARWQHIHSSRISALLSASPPRCPAPSFPAAGQPWAAVPRGVPALGTCWVFTGEPAGKSHVNHLVLMQEIIEQSCTH